MFILETPFSLTIFVTRFGVSAEKVVATIEIPKSHQGIFLPDKKYSYEFFPDFFDVNRPITMKVRKKRSIMVQSRFCNCMLFDQLIR